PIFAYALDTSGVMVGLVSSVWFFVRVFLEIPSGVLSDIVGRRILLILGLAASTIGAALCSLANNIYILIAGRTLWGLGTGLFFMSSSAIIFDIFHSGRGTALGTFQSIEFIGSFIGAPIGSFMASITGYRQVFAVSAILGAASFTIAYLSEGLRQVGAKRFESRGKLLSIRKVLPGLRNMGLTSVYIGSFSRMFVWTGIAGTVFPLFLNLHLNVPVEIIGVITSMRTLGIIASTAISGRLSDRIGRKPVIAAGMLIEALSLYTYTNAPASSLIISTISFVEGFGRGMVLTSLMVLLSDLAPQSLRGSAMGVYRTFMDAGGLTGPIFFMVIYEAFGPTAPFVSAAILVLATSALIVAA
ncbi:MAG: MFS transporter, partial [Candidatus Bathyarchaeia archaeon]